MASRLQKLHLDYKSGISFTNIQLSIINNASRFTKWHLALQLTEEFVDLLDNLINI
ncbi:hypothetical protein bsdcttw_10280 [Anaerocolumna chitinilytica]|uniref:Uncharacterized protein n=1 Tax=Anaerocolumna chitinilytica TaxID=1727145 RepID=A0A7I8DJX7_9FIRM|nr:hypothetical protein bsdcttw_10280 [Anaerocolumna chitinilytica]